MTPERLTELEELAAKVLENAISDSLATENEYAVGADEHALSDQDRADIDSFRAGFSELLALVRHLTTKEEESD